MKILKWVSSFMIKKDVNEKSLPGLRETFNGIKPAETVTADIKRELYKVDVKNGSIDLYLYSDEKPPRIRLYCSIFMVMVSLVVLIVWLRSH